MHTKMLARLDRQLKKQLNTCFTNCNFNKHLLVLLYLHIYNNNTLLILSIRLYQWMYKF